MPQPPGTATHRIRTVALTITSAAVLIAIGLLVLGGFRLVVTRGDSMEPHFFAGDLVLVHEQPQYRVGDVVAYDSPSLGITMLHRIVGVRDGGFVTRGDNNDWDDPDLLTATDLSGRLVLRIPRAGAMIESLRGPVGSILVGTLFLAVLAIAWGQRSRRRRRRRQMPPTGQHRAPVVAAPRRPAPTERGRRSRVPAVLVAVATLLAVAAVWSAPRPASATAPVIPQDTLAVSYEAAVPAGATYPNGRVATGDPIFLNLVRTLTVRAAHSGPAAGPVTLTARLEHPSGWRRPVPLSTTSEDGSSSATLDLDAVSATLTGLTTETGLPTTGAMLIVLPAVGSWSTQARFTFDGVQLTPDPATLTATRQAAPTAAAAPETGYRAVLAPLGRLLPDWPLRLAATFALLALGAVAVWLLRRPADPLRAHRIVPVAEYAPGAGRTLVELPAPAPLARLAEAENLPIFRSETAAGVEFFIDDGAVVYRYRPEPGLEPAALGYFADRLAAEIVGRIATEFRAPLATIQGYTEMLTDAPNGSAVPAQRTMLEAIDRGVNRLHELIDDVTVLAEPPSEYPDTIEVRDLLAAGTRPLAEALRERDTRLTTSLDGDVPRVVGDREKLVWALGELVDAASLEVGAGGRLTVRANRDGDEVVLTITGQTASGGNGANPDQAPRDGLADSVAVVIVDRHGGSVERTTTPTGATITVRLPAETPTRTR
ncbi:signal peptidase I [Actinophytocola xanthii]|uniref:Signal peptidase I n=1 Tax=Actinophytocola xanthii TaxID=1912961 RepID=A0A1Q8C2K4_9PSEU|nr:signal peptidase I [Actinophytocola xanthii]OLF08588.1 signal peptidase I [Actinophytocola xanthii]